MYYLPNNGYFDQSCLCDQTEINELNSYLDMGDEDRESDNVFDEYFELNSYLWEKHHCVHFILFAAMTG